MLSGKICCAVNEVMMTIERCWLGREKCLGGKAEQGNNMIQMRLERKVYSLKLIILARNCVQAPSIVTGSVAVEQAKDKWKNRLSSARVKSNEPAFNGGSSCIAAVVK
jgi:hypothetical protein